MQVKDVLESALSPIANHARFRRIAGGFQTDVYGSDDHHYVVKIKNEPSGPMLSVLARARAQRQVADQFIALLGPDHTISSDYVITGPSCDDAHLLVIQPFIAHARPLRSVDFDMLNHDERAVLAAQLQAIICQALRSYRRYGYMPDLGGFPSNSPEDRRRLKALYLAPLHVWNFLRRQTLLRSHNLLLSADDLRIILVDYDLVHRWKLVGWIYYTVRALLFARDWWLIERMKAKD